MCSREPTWAASKQSRAMIASSATAGQPVQPEASGQLALVHLSVLGEPGLLGVLCDDAVEGLDVLERPPHQYCVADALPVVGEDPHPRRGVGHRAELGQPLAAEPDGDRADREDIAVAGLAAQRQTCSTTPAVSATGSVFAIACTAVKPPIAAACVPVSTVSASSRPGSRRCVCRSTRPGRATSPQRRRPRHRSGALRDEDPVPRGTGRSARRRARRRSSGCQVTRGSRFRATKEQVEDGHPDRDTVGHLLDDHRSGRSRRRLR